MTYSLLIPSKLRLEHKEKTENGLPLTFPLQEMISLKNLSRLALTTALLASAIPLHAEADERPNVLLILADDLGYSDLGSYGGEIETPTLDRLANKGLRFTQFYNTAKCHSSRISLLTGRYPLQAGIFQDSNKSIDRSTTIAENLSDQGYYTAMVGKWHLENEPQDYGFGRYFGHLSGATNYFSGDATWRLDREPFSIPAKGFYATTAKADYALTFLDEARQGDKPWFLYMAFNAPHAPLQVLKEDYEKYEKLYEKGWDKIHAERIARQEQLELFDYNIDEPGRPEHIPAWEELSETQRNFEIRRGAAYAALVDRLDIEIRRVVENIEQAGELDNTIILFLSDNGACPYERPSRGRDLFPYEHASNWNDSTGWAWARNAPFRMYKQNQYEGGSSTPAILHWPAGLKAKAGSTDPTPVHIIDILPTIAAVTQTKIPSSWPQRDLTNVAGESFAPLLAGKRMSREKPIFLHFQNDRGLRDGDWKIVSFQAGPWELYNIAQDRAEQNNLSHKYPERVKSMVTQWAEMGTDTAHLIPRMVKPVQKETETARAHWEWSDYHSDPSTTISEASAKRENPARRK